MSNKVTRRIVLTGGRKGYSGPLGTFQAQNGYIVLEGTDADVLAQTRFIEMMWAGFPEGDPRIEDTERAIAYALVEEERLAKAEAAAKAVRLADQAVELQRQADEAKAASKRAQLEATNGERDSEKGVQESDGQPDLSGAVQPDGSRASAGDPSNVGSGAAGAQAGSEGQSVSDQDRQSPSLKIQRLTKALMSLDPTNDTHWTPGDKPSLPAVERFLGSAGVTRADIEVAIPGFRRPKP